MKHFLFASFLFLSFTSCVRKPIDQDGKTPEQVVKEFIDMSAAVKDVADKAKLEALCAGELRRAFERMTGQAFQIAYTNSNVKIRDVKFLKTHLEKDLAQVHYEVSVENSAGTDTTQETVQREVDLTRPQGSWRIEFIRAVGTDKIAFTRGMIF